MELESSSHAATRAVRAEVPGKGTRRYYGVWVDQNEYVVGWGTLTLINAGLAQSKGRSGLAWFLLSLLLGPLATLLVVVLPQPESHVAGPTNRD